MQTVFALILLCLGIGAFVRVYNGWVRLLLIAVISVVLLYMYIA